MSFTKLEDRINGLPLVLAGPIVRRVEPESVTVWVVLRHRRGIRMEVYDANGLVVGDGERDTLEVGKNLHIACVTAKPRPPSNRFTDGTTYQYDLFFDQFGTPDDIPSGGSLFSPRIVAESVGAAGDKLTYASDGGPARPSFVLPPADLNDLRLLHGSCRKISGEHSDALEAADHILREAFKSNGRRPHMLFLTGDNIYNDGCERESFEVILDAALVLLGWDETMPGVDKPLREMAGRRWGFSLNDAGFVNPGRWGSGLLPDFSHLFGLGEIIALHLLTFADVLWPDDLDYQRGTFQFRGTLPAVRRALANVATYMIFDNHEFSDQWNVTADWVESVLFKPMGRRVYQNALAAYALCQGWGNDPGQFEDGAGKALFEAIEAWSAAELADPSSSVEPLAQISTSLGLPDAQLFHELHDWSHFHGPGVVRWYYTVPCPPLDIVVLDMYMWRSYASAVANPLLISEPGLREQIGNRLTEDKECSLIVVSNVAITLPGRKTGELNLDDISSEAFVWGVGGLSLLVLIARLFWPVALLIFLITLIVSGLLRSLGPVPTVAKTLRALRYRHEWGTNYVHHSEGFELLMAHAAYRAPPALPGDRRARVVFLSGDLHHSFCMRMEYWGGDPPPFGLSGGPVEGVLAQLVGSPCKWVNPEFTPLKDTAIHYYAGWREKPPLTPEPEWKSKKSPWVMECGASQASLNPAPEWRYSLQPVQSALHDTSVPIDVPDHPNPTIDDYLEEMAEIERILLGKAERPHDLKVNNLGDVTFLWLPQEKKVIHTVWWRARPAVDPVWTVTQFFVDMTPSPWPPQLPQ